MKKGSNLRCNWLVMTLVALGVFIFFNSFASSEGTHCGTLIEKPLHAGQTMYVVGKVIVSNDAENLYVTFMTSGNWRFTETHLAVCSSDLECVPVNKKGNPVPGRFPYHSSHEPSIPQYTYEIPLDSWNPGTPLYIAAHAVVWCLTDEFDETAWGGCLLFPYGTRWAYYIEYTVQGCPSIGSVDAD